MSQRRCRPGARAGFPWTGVALFAAALCATVGAAAPLADDPDDPPQAPQANPPKPLVVTDEARELAGAITAAVGGPSALDDLRVLRFAFVIEADGREVGRRDVVFDRANGRLRVALKTRRGEVVVLLDVDSAKGVAFHDGERVPREDEAGLVAYGRSVAENDLGWLLLPWRLSDPGVYLGRLPDEAVGDRECRVLEVIPSAQVPIPPGVRYVIHADAATGEVVRVAFATAAMKKDQPPLVFEYGEFVAIGSARFSTTRTQVGGPQVIRFVGLAAPAELEDGLFEGLDDS